MPISPTYPGVYIEEVPSGIRTITGVATSITAFIGRARRGPGDEPTRIQSFSDYERIFGRLWAESTMSYAVSHYFLHGGTDALIVRVHNGAGTATLTLPAGAETLTLAATSPGAWGNNLKATVDHETRDKDELAPDTHLFNLKIEELDPDTGEAVAAETFLNVSSSEASARFVSKVLEYESQLVEIQGVVPAVRPDAAAAPANNDGADGNPLTDAQLTGDPTLRTGIYALDKADLFNLLCIPPPTRGQDTGVDTTLAKAAAYCKTHRALLIVDPGSAWTTVAAAESGVNDVRSKLGNTLAGNAAVYFPHLKMADPLKENRTATFVPCGAIAGIFARTDSQRGVWKAPAGLEASLAGVRELSYKLSNAENGKLNPLGLNCLRTFPVYGNVVWGARTLAGADRLASEWKYVPVRRLTLYIEESLYRGTQWVVFEPNDEPLWAQIRLNVSAFMQNLFRQGAFQGTSPRDAYFVKCDRETTTRNDIDRGVVNILVGFAPLKPAEFVIIRIQQIAGQTAA